MNHKLLNESKLEWFSKEKITVFLFTVFLATAISYNSFNVRNAQSKPEIRNLNVEINSTVKSLELNFFNETLEISMEEGDYTRFYLDLDGKGNADMELDNLVRDGEVRSSKHLIDYRSGVYVLEVQYSIENRTERDWLKVEKIEKID